MLRTALQQKGDLAGAVGEFRTAIRLAPLSPQYHNTLGNALRQQGDLAAARAEFAEAARLNKLKSDSQAAMFAVNIGIQKLKEGKLNEAIERLTEAVKLDPNNALAHYHLSLAWKKKGNLAASRASLKRARELDPRLGTINP